MKKIIFETRKAFWPEMGGHDYHYHVVIEKDENDIFMNIKDSTFTPKKFKMNLFCPFREEYLRLFSYPFDIQSTCYWFTGDDIKILYKLLKKEGIEEINL